MFYFTDMILKKNFTGQYLNGKVSWKWPPLSTVPIYKSANDSVPQTENRCIHVLIFLFHWYGNKEKHQLAKISKIKCFTLCYTGQR